MKSQQNFCEQLGKTAAFMFHLHEQKLLDGPSPSSSTRGVCHLTTLTFWLCLLGMCHCCTLGDVWEILNFFPCKTQILLCALKSKLFLELFYVFRKYRNIHKVVLVSVSCCARKWRGVQVNCFQRPHVFWTCSPHCICLFSSLFAVSSLFFLPSWKQFPTDVHCHAMILVKEKLYCLLLPHCGKQEVWQMMFPDRKLMQGIGVSVISKKSPSRAI